MVAVKRNNNFSGFALRGILLSAFQPGTGPINSFNLPMVALHLSMRGLQLLRMPMWANADHPEPILFLDSPTASGTAPLCLKRQRRH